MLPQLDELKGYLARNRGTYPITEAFPFDALQALERAGVALSVDAIPLLVPFLDLAHKFDDINDGYEGGDLKRESVVVGVLALCPHDPAVEQSLASSLSYNTFERHHAMPGSPAADKYDRDMAVEDAQDMLALALARALERIKPRTRETLAVLERARRHRDPDVAAIARRIVGTKRLTETAITRWFDHFRSLSYASWIPRLLGPDRMTEHCAKTRWIPIALPAPVVHPGCSQNGAKPIENLLGISSDDLESCVYDPSFEPLGGVLELRARLAALNVKSDAAASPGTHRGWLLRQFESSDVPPESMCPLVVPIPPATLFPTVTGLASAFLETVERARKLANLRPPEIVLRGEWTNLQREFDTLYWAIVEALDALAA